MTERQLPEFMRRERDAREARKWIGFLIGVAILIAVGSLAAINAYAQTAGDCPGDADCITVGYPTTYTDGTPLAASELAGGIIEIKTATGWQHLATLVYPATSYTRQPVTGQQTYRWRVLTKAGGFSTFTEATPPKEPSPGTIRVVDNRAYKPDLGYVGQLKVKFVGIVPVGSLCSDSNRYQDYHVVDRKLLRNVDGSKPQVLPKQVLARCG